MDKLDFTNENRHVIVWINTTNIYLFCLCAYLFTTFAYMKYKIKTTTEIAARKVTGGRKLKYPFDKIEAGQQLDIETKDKQNVATSAYNYAKRKKIDFTIRRTETGLTIYRTK